MVLELVRRHPCCAISKPGKQRIFEVTWTEHFSLRAGVPSEWCGFYIGFHIGFYIFYCILHSDAMFPSFRLVFRNTQITFPFCHGNILVVIKSAHLCYVVFYRGPMIESDSRRHLAAQLAGVVQESECRPRRAIENGAFIPGYIGWWSYALCSEGCKPSVNFVDLE